MLLLVVSAGFTMLIVIEAPCTKEFTERYKICCEITNVLVVKVVE